ncbi:hypothetical protein [Streptomyces sp. NPDC048057]|uniref:effector-associated constant component EACC1 n=1 Tax=Streptomyces sp. NPDC048057 TaxID=3155628 RepID=UPI0033C59553
MLVQLRAEPDDGVLTTLDLYTWLRRDPDVRDHSRLSLDASDPSGETMGAVEVINLVLGQTFTALNLALSYANWRAARPTAPAISLTVDGRSLALQGVSEETLSRIVDLLAARETDASDESPRDDDEPEPV